LENAKNTKFPGSSLHGNPTNVSRNISVKTSAEEPVIFADVLWQRNIELEEQMSTLQGKLTVSLQALEACKMLMSLGTEHTLLDAEVLRELSELKRINISRTAEISSQLMQDNDAKLMHIVDLEDRLSFCSFCSIEEEKPTRDDEDEDLMHYLMGEAFDDEYCDFELMDHV
jgi:hypothetical protein